MKKRIALITGASAGIGRACAEILAENGYDLILAGRRKAMLDELSEELKQKYHVQTRVSVTDVRDRKAVQDMAASLQGEWQNIQVLINNAGLALGLAGFENGDPDHWDTMMDTNVKGLLYVTRFMLPYMDRSGAGHIVNVGSIAGKEIYQNGNVYCASKHAVDAISKSLRLELSNIPIRVSAIHPGAVETEFSIVRFEGDRDRAKAVYKGFENLVARDVAEGVWFMLNRPAHVNINEMTIMPTAQPAAGVIHRKENHN